jgi:hypothetical protein
MKRLSLALNKRVRVGLSVTGIACFAAIAVGVATNGGVATASSNPAPGTAPISSADYQAGQVAPLSSGPDAADSSTFSVFRQAATAAIPEKETGGLVGSSFTGVYGANLALAREASGLPAGTAWVVPADGSICLIAASRTYASGAPAAGALGGATCADDADAAAGNLQFVSGSRADPGVQYVVGVVPDGVSDVYVTSSGGSVDDVTVHDNVYEDTVAGTVSTVAFTGPSGPVAIDDSSS